jgi:erythromycin esterase
MEAVIAYLERVDPEAVPAARRAYKCFEPYGEDVREYARATALVPTSCEDEVVEVLSELRDWLPEYRDDPESRLNAEQNALVVKDADMYFPYYQSPAPCRILHSLPASHLSAPPP